MFTHVPVQVSLEGLTKGMLGIVTVNSMDYFSLLLVFASVSIGTQYSMGFFGLLWQALTIVVAVSGVILSPCMPALRSSTWAGYLAVSAMFTCIVGPLFGGVEPALLHIYAFACAIVVGECHG